MEHDPKPRAGRAQYSAKAYASRPSFRALGGLLWSSDTWKDTLRCGQTVLKPETSFQKCYCFYFWSLHCEFTCCISFLIPFWWSWHNLEDFWASLVKHFTLCSFSSISSSVCVFSFHRTEYLSLLGFLCLPLYYFQQHLFLQHAIMKVSDLDYFPPLPIHTFLDFILNPDDQSSDVTSSWAEWGGTRSHIAWYWRWWNVGKQIWIILWSCERTTVRPKPKRRSGLWERGAQGKDKGEWEQNAVFTSLVVKERSLKTAFTCRTHSVANKQEGSCFQFPQSAVICFLQPASDLHVELVFKTTYKQGKRGGKWAQLFQTLLFIHAL